MTAPVTATLTDFLLARIAEDEASIPAGLEPESWCDRNEGVHLSRSRALAECEAKRQIVEAAQTASARLMISAPAYRLVTKILALPYADHPDYRQEWRA